jgi:short-subunit dehydrogenase
MQIPGMTALVTGASSGIGAATAQALAARGAHVLLLARDRDRDRERLAAVALAIRTQSGRAVVYPVDLSDPNPVAAVAKAVLKDTGALDILVNNAGAGRRLSVLETSPDELQQMMALPFFAAFNLTREFLPAMRQRGSGRIVNVTSVASRLVWPGATAYTAARCAVDALTKGLRLELAGSGIGVTLAMFGTVDSEYWKHNHGSRERLPGIAAMARTLTPDEVGAAIVSGVERNRRLVLRPGIYYVILVMSTLFPWVTEWLTRSTGWRDKSAKQPS